MVRVHNNLGPTGPTWYSTYGGGTMHKDYILNQIKEIIADKIILS